MLRHSSLLSEKTYVYEVKRLDAFLHAAWSVTLLSDNPAATPFVIVPPVAIGNRLSGTPRKIMAERITFLAGDTAFTGLLSVATPECADPRTYQYGSGTPYAVGSQAGRV